MTPSQLDRRANELAATQRALITHDQALELGMTVDMIKTRLRQGRWEIAARRVYRIGGSERSPHQDLHAEVLAAGPLAAASGRSAAALWRLPGFRLGRVAVTSPYGKSHHMPNPTRRHSCDLPASHITVLGGIRVTTPARTIFDLAGILNPRGVERALDNALAMGITDLARLRGVLDELGRRGRKGTALMRRLLEVRGDGYVAPESELEALFAECVDEAGVRRPDAQITVGDEAEQIGRVDYVYRPEKAVFEVDSRRHHSALLDLEADRLRDNRLGKQGLRVFRVTYHQLTRRRHEVIELLRAVVRTAA